MKSEHLDIGRLKYGKVPPSYWGIRDVLPGELDSLLVLRWVEYP